MSARLPPPGAASFGKLQMVLSFDSDLKELQIHLRRCSKVIRLVQAPGRHVGVSCKMPSAYYAGNARAVYRAISCREIGTSEQGQIWERWMKT